MTTVTVPIEPSIGLLTSMALRYDHGLGVPGYYDSLLGPGEHNALMHSIIMTMRKLHEEIGQKILPPIYQPDMLFSENLY